MISLHMNTEQIKMAISPRCLDVLIIIQIDEIAEKCTPHVNMAIESSGVSREDVVKWDKFWQHFNRFWRGNTSFMIILNMYSTANAEIEILTRVNNSLERQVIHK